MHGANYLAIGYKGGTSLIYFISAADGKHV